MKCAVLRKTVIYRKEKNLTNEGVKACDKKYFPIKNTKLVV